MTSINVVTMPTLWKGDLRYFQRVDDRWVFYINTLQRTKVGVKRSRQSRSARVASQLGFLPETLHDVKLVLIDSSESLCSVPVIRQSNEEPLYFGVGEFRGTSVSCKKRRYRFCTRLALWNAEDSLRLFLNKVSFELELRNIGDTAAVSMETICTQ